MKEVLWKKKHSPVRLVMNFLKTLMLMNDVGDSMPVFNKNFEA